MKYIIALFASLLSAEVYASGGFTWISSAIHALHIPVPEHFVTFLLIAFVLIVSGLVYRSSLKRVGKENAVIPDKGITFRNIVELYGNFIYGQCKAIIGEEAGPKYFPFISTVFITILLSNLVGLIPGFLPPTEHLSTTLALGLFAFVYYNIKGCKEQGTINYLKHFAGPLWYLAFLIFPIEIISNLIRPMSLALRLRSNMMGDHLVLNTFSGLAPLLVPIPFYILGILVSCIQAYVFTVLTMVYINLAVTHHDHDEEHAH